MISVHEEKKPSRCKNSFSFNFVTPWHVKRIIRRLKNTKAMGSDKIPTEVWKKGASVLAGPIAKICNISMSAGEYPD